MAHVKEDLRYERRCLFAVIALLTLIGLIFIYSSSSVYALERFGSSYYFLKKQMICLVPSLIAFFIFALFPLNLLRRLAPLLFISTVVLIACTLFSPFGLRVHGSSRWLMIGGYGVQPSELLKVTLFMYMGNLFVKKERFFQSFLMSFLPFLLVLGLVFFITS
jgi:cell division protein FtsW